MKTFILRVCSLLYIMLSFGMYHTCLGQSTYPRLLNDVFTAVQGDVQFFTLSPDGSHAVYLADHDTDSVYELYSAPLAGGTPVKLNSTLVPGGSVHISFQISADSSRVVYLADQDTDGIFELYSVTISGGTPVKLNGALVPGRSVLDFQISADSSRVVYRADQDADDVFELYSVPLAGGTAVKLNSTLVSGGWVLGIFQISADSSRVVYRADQSTDGVYEIYSVPLAGGTPVKLNGTLVSGGSVESDFRISVDSSRVVYRSYQDNNYIYELFSVPLVGGAQVKLNNALVSGGDVFNFQISADSSRVIYRADQDTDNVNELYSVAINGGTPVKLNGALVSGGDVMSGFQISAVGSRVVYQADQSTDNTFELYSVAINGGTPVKLNGTLVSGGDVEGTFQISADGSCVVYQADQDADNTLELYSVAISGGSPVKLNSTLVSGGNVNDFQLSADGSRVVYRADQITDNAFELYSVAITGGTPVKLNGALVMGGNVLSGFLISADSCSIVYRAAQERAGADLYVWRAQAIWTSSGGAWPETLNWQAGVEPDATLEAVIARSAWVRVPFGSTSAAANSLVLGGGGGLSIVELVDGAVLELRHGALLGAGASLRGDGMFDLGVTPLFLPSDADIRAGAGQYLTLQSGRVESAGRILALGTAFEACALEFSGALSNRADTGVITGHDAILFFAQGVANSGSMIFGSGINDVIGQVDNLPGGRITVSGGALAIFYEDVANNGVINVSAAGDTRSTAVFFGALSGNGISGGGEVFIEGDARPGFSPGVMTFGGDVSFGPMAVLDIEIGGTAPGTGYDRIAVAGQLMLGGTLRVRLANNFVPEAGAAFDLWDAGSASGQFSAEELPPLPAGRFWHVAELAATGVLRVGLTPESYAEYALFYGVTGGAADDQDGDRIPNLVEYLLGTNPLSADPAATGLRLWRVPVGTLVQFDMTAPSGSDLIVELQAATTLAAGGDWTTLSTRTGNGPWSGSISIEQNVIGAGLVQVDAVEPLSGTSRFYRYIIRLAL